MKRAFISDLHLDRTDEDRFLRFHEFLNVESDRMEEIYILGDLVESWIGDDDDSDYGVSVFRAYAADDNGLLRRRCSCCCS